MEPVSDPLLLVEGAVGGVEASLLPATVALGSLRVTAASPTPVVVETSVETARPGESLSPLETEALVAVEMNRRAFKSAELRIAYAGQRLEGVRQLAGRL